jgi:hypothetical protein
MVVMFEPRYIRQSSYCLSHHLEFLDIISRNLGTLFVRCLFQLQSEMLRVSECLIDIVSVSSVTPPLFVVMIVGILIICLRPIIIAMLSSVTGRYSSRASVMMCVRLYFLWLV